MKEYYKINEISKLYGVGTDSLRYYEKLGILKPHRDKNGYRLYSLKDMYKLNMIRDLRSLDFSMQQIKEYLDEQSLFNTLSTLRQEISLVHSRMDELKNKERLLRKRISSLTQAMQKETGVFKIIALPQRLCVRINEHITRDEEMDFVMKKLHRIHEQKIKDFGNQTVGASFAMEKLSRGESNVYDSVFFVLDAHIGAYDFELPEGDYLSCFYRGSYEQNGWRVQEALSWIQKQGLRALGSPFELYAIDNRDTGLESEFLTEIQIRVSSPQEGA